MWHVGWSWSGRVNICFSGALYCRNSLQEKAHTHTHTRTLTHLFPQLCLSSPRSWASPQTFWLVSWANEGGAPHSCPIRTSRRLWVKTADVTSCSVSKHHGDAQTIPETQKTPWHLITVWVCVCVCDARVYNHSLILLQLCLSVPPPAVWQINWVYQLSER